MKILDGKFLSEKILKSLGEEIKNLRQKPTLAVILVGDDTISKVFIKQKEISCQKAGIVFRLFKFPAGINQKELKNGIEEIVRDVDNSGVIIQLPLPPKFDIQEILNIVPKEKDVDVLSEESLGKFYQGTLKILPPTVNGILQLLRAYKIKLRGKNVVVVGAGRLVGFPLAVQLLKEKSTLSVLNEFTKDAPAFTKKADILVSGVGKPNLIKGNMVKKGAIVIDAGTSMLGGKVVGDVDFKSVSKKASCIASVPGGVGPMTVACLLENLTGLSK